jgi:hypothetical protein
MIQVRAAGGLRTGDLPRHERLAALYRFHNGEAPAEVRFFAVDTALTDPDAIDWTTFPMLDALEAVTRDELARLRALVPEGAPPPSRRGVSAWGLGW